MNSAPDLNLEQAVLLALGWRRAAECVVREGAAPGDGDIPPHVEAPHAYAEEQRCLAVQALETLTQAIEERLRETADRGQVAFRKRAQIINQMETGKLDAAKANERARQASRALDDCREEATRWDMLLRMIRDEVPAQAPALPLCRYHQAYGRLRQTEDSREDAPPPRTSQATRDTSTRGDSVPVRATRFFLNRTDRLDRIALCIAFVLCSAVFVFAYQYIYHWGRLDIEIERRDDRQVTVRCINSMRHTVLLHVPYDGLGLPEEPPHCFGILVEAMEDGRPLAASLPVETLWSHKDLPAHLYGTVVLGTMSATEFILDLSALNREETVSALRLTLYRAPNRRYASYTLPLH